MGARGRRAAAHLNPLTLHHQEHSAPLSAGKTLQWQVLRKREPDVSGERAATLPLQARNNRVEKSLSIAMQPSDI